jgi:hypothetical protein
VKAVSQFMEVYLPTDIGKDVEQASDPSDPCVRQGGKRLRRYFGSDYDLLVRAGGVGHPPIQVIKESPKTGAIGRARMG